MPPGQSVVRLLVVALALGWSADILFYRNLPGISVLLFVGLLLAALFGLGRQAGVSAVPANLWLLAPLLFFAAMVFIRANIVLTLVNLGMVGGLLGLLAFFYAAGRVERLGVPGYPLALAASVHAVLTRPAPPVLALARDSERRRRVRRVAPVARGLLLAAPVLTVFTCLFSSADLVFADYVAELLRLQFLAELPELAWRLAWIGAVAWVSAGGLLFALSRRAHVEDESLPGVFPRRFGIGFMEGATVLALVDGLFLAFAWVQFTYLFSGEAARTMHYEVYREYARRGFGELLVVAVLTLGLILGLRWLTWQETTREARILKALSTLMIALAGVLLVSAFMRMVTWEQVQYYINTPLRLYVRWFIFWLGVTFGWLALTLWLRPQRFAIGAFVALLAFCATINLIDPDDDVARYNLARNDELSTRFLSLLSEDAVPVLVAGLDTATGAVQIRLREHLTARLAALEQDRAHQTWPAFHWARWRAYEALRGLQQAGRLAGSARGP